METWQQKPAYLCLQEKQAQVPERQKELSALLEQMDDDDDDDDDDGGRTHC